ncbi:MAG: ImmA/IrrE family metallo-endopeptidase [Dehalococcoidia bacterium]
MRYATNSVSPSVLSTSADGRLLSAAARRGFSVAARRPMARRNYTCAHELGTTVQARRTIDELAQDERLTVATNPNEFLAETFAGFLLMPTLGVRKAFADRGWSASTATPWELFTVACSFGVGYTTLIRHLASA